MENAYRGEGGFTLVEVIVAVVILSVGILALAGTTGHVFGRLTSAGAKTERSVLHQQMIEEIRALPFDSLKSTAQSREIGEYTVTWRVNAQPSTQLKRVEIVTRGPGYPSGSRRITDFTDTIYVSVSK